MLQLHGAIGLQDETPISHYAKRMMASATVLGIIAGMMPLLTVFQIPAASHVSRAGYKRFVYAGWGMRVMFIVGLALVPLLSAVLEPAARLAERSCRCCRLVVTW